VSNFWNFPSGLLVSSLYVWIPVQVVNLYWVPLLFRVLHMNVSVMIWTVYLAAKLNRKANCSNSDPTGPSANGMLGDYTTLDVLTQRSE
jgi:hypothetical protein